MLKKATSILRSILFFEKEKAETPEVQELRAAAERGDAEAQYTLGVAYLKGEGVAQHYGEAVNWFRLASQQGFKKAKTALSDMYPPL